MQDMDGVTVGMRGYFGFNYRRFRHSISPYTPSVLVELGFLSNPSEEEKLQNPEYREQLVEALVRAVMRYRAQIDNLRAPIDEALP